MYMIVYFLQIKAYTMYMFFVVLYRFKVINDAVVLRMTQDYSSNDDVIGLIKFYYAVTKSCEKRVHVIYTCSCVLNKVIFLMPDSCMWNTCILTLQSQSTRITLVTPPSRYVRLEMCA